MYLTTYDFAGDPEDLLRRYRAMLEEIGPQNLLFHAAGPTDTGIRVVDACPSREVHDQFVTQTFPPLLAKHGLPAATESNAFDVHFATASGTEVAVPA